MGSCGTSGARSTTKPLPRGSCSTLSRTHGTSFTSWTTILLLATFSPTSLVSFRLEERSLQRPPSGDPAPVSRCGFGERPSSFHFQLVPCYVISPPDHVL